MVIENEILKVEFRTVGAEIQSIFHKQEHREYIWQRDPAFWAKSSPVLFPVVGGLKNNSYSYEGKVYSMSKHGFARDKNFTVTHASSERIVFSLTPDSDTNLLFPFEWQLNITYSLSGNELHVIYEIENKDDKIIYFSIGAHPAFALDLTNATIEDYYIEFEEDNLLTRNFIRDNIVLKKETKIQLNQHRLFLNPHLFDEDCLIFEHLKSRFVYLKCTKNNYQVSVSFSGFDFFGLWAPPKAPFVCLEPWCGINDLEDHSSIIQYKKGIEKVDPGQSWAKQWSMYIGKK